MRGELSCVADRLANAERAAAEQSAAAALAQHQHGAARDQARHSGAQLQRLRVTLMRNAQPRPVGLNYFTTKTNLTTSPF